MLRVEKPLKKPQQLRDGGAGGDAGDGSQLPYFSLSCGSTASSSAWSALPCRLRLGYGFAQRHQIIVEVADVGGVGHIAMPGDKRS